MSANQNSRTTKLLLGIIFAALLVRLLVTWQPIPLLVQKTLPDDAFYYFAIAQNMVAGNGVTVDGVTLTNGFHPLWALLLLGPYVLAQNGDLPVHLSLTLAALIDVVSVYIAFNLVRHISGRAAAGLLAALFYAFHPLVIMESQNGLETSLAVMMFAATSWVYLVRVRREGVGYGNYALLGVSAGLMLLARTDSLFLLLVIGIDSLLRYGFKTFMVGDEEAERRGGEDTKSFSPDSRPLTPDRLVSKRIIPFLGWTISGVIIALLLLPWIWWNVANFGTVVQSSAVAAPQLIRYSLTEPVRRGVPFADVFRDGYMPILLLSFTFTVRYAGLPLFAAVASLIITRLLDGRFPSLKGLHVLWLPFLGALLPVLVHTFVRWYPRSWYYVPLAWAAAVVGGAIIDKAAQHWPKRRGFDYLRVGGVSILIIILALQSVKVWREGFYPWQNHMLAGARWMAQSAPPDAVVASFNSGLQAYYGERATINLDGVVNWDAITAMDERALLAYARSRGATHLVDYQAYIFNTFYPFFEEGFQTQLLQVTELSPQFPPYGAVGVYEIAE